MKKLIFGIITAVLGISAMATSFVMIVRGLPSEGPWAGKITQFHPVFPGQGIVIVALLAAGGLLFLVGLIFTVIGSKEKS